MSDSINRGEFLKAAMLLSATGAATLGGVRSAKAQEHNTFWEASLGEIKDINEKEPVLVKAKFFDADGLLMEEEKVFVRWERVNKNVGRWIVLSALCTHLKCVIEYADSEGIFQCPCHGSQFDLEGAVINRPAKKPLTDYSELVEERDGKLILKREPS